MVATVQVADENNRPDEREARPRIGRELGKGFGNTTLGVEQGHAGELQQAGERQGVAWELGGREPGEPLRCVVFLR